MVTSGSLGSVMVSTLVWNARDVGSIPTPGATPFHFHQIHDSGFHDQDLVKLRVA